MSRIARVWASRKGKVVILFAVLLLLVGISYVGVEATSTPEFCGLCHEMEPVIVSWKNSEHYTFDGEIRATCRDCHIPPWNDPVATLSVKITHGCRDLYLHFGAKETMAREPDYYFRLKENALPSMTDAMCLHCHADVRDPEKDRVTIDGKVIQGLHLQPEALKVSCIICHKHIGHGYYD